jgi:hypothetical protein
MKRTVLLLTAAMPLAFVSISGILQTSLLGGAYAQTSAALSQVDAAKTAPTQAGGDIKETQGQSVWPLPSAYEWYWHQSNENLSASQIETSMSAIKTGVFMNTPNNQSGPISSVSVSSKKIQFNYTMGVSLIETYFPIKLLRSMRLYYASAQPQGQKWLVTITLAAANLQAFFKTEADARSFIDAATSAAKMADVKLEDKEKRGFAVSDLTPAQAQALGKTRIDSALVSMIALGGPAEKTGLLFLDLVTEVDGLKIRNADHFSSILDAVAPGSILKLSCLERTEVMEGGTHSYLWKAKIIDWK